MGATATEPILPDAVNENQNGGIFMIELSNTTAQTLASGQSITFDTVLMHTGNGECYRKNTGSVKMRANGIYEVKFNGNISGATAGTAVSLAIQQGGVTLPETAMITTPAVANDVNNVSCSTLIKNCCGDYDRVTIVNTGTADLTISANPTFTIRRVS